MQFIEEEINEILVWVGTHDQIPIKIILENDYNLI